MGANSYIRPCNVCGEKISMRKMPHGQWVSFDYNTNNPHKHGNKNKSLSYHKEKTSSSKLNNYPPKLVKDNWIKDYKKKKLKNPNSSLGAGEAQYTWEGKVYTVERRGDENNEYRIRYKRIRNIYKKDSTKPAVKRSKPLNETQISKLSEFKPVPINNSIDEFGVSSNKAARINIPVSKIPRAKQKSELKTNKDFETNPERILELQKQAEEERIFQEKKAKQHQDHLEYLKNRFLSNNQKISNNQKTKELEPRKEYPWIVILLIVLLIVFFFSTDTPLLAIITLFIGASFLSIK